VRRDPAPKGRDFHALVGVQALLERRSTTAGLLIKPMREPPARIIQVGAKLREFITAPGSSADASSSIWRADGH